VYARRINTPSPIVKTLIVAWAQNGALKRKNKTKPKNPLLFACFRGYINRTHAVAPNDDRDKSDKTNRF